jgi:two-component system cell cycle sensor histidine kinase/response regulator CckA
MAARAGPLLAPRRLPDCSRRQDRAAHIDLLITDVVMPDASGVELARRLRDQRPTVPVLFISGYGGEELNQRGIQMERAELLVKPFRHEELVTLVRRMLDAAGRQTHPQPA